jgi:hypothetical protein
LAKQQASAGSQGLVGVQAPLSVQVPVQLAWVVVVQAVPLQHAPEGAGQENEPQLVPLPPQVEPAPLARHAELVRSPTQKPLTQQAPIWKETQGSGVQVEPRVWKTPEQPA